MKTMTTNRPFHPGVQQQDEVALEPLLTKETEKTLLGCVLAKPESYGFYLQDLDLLLSHHSAVAVAIKQLAEANIPITTVAAFQRAFEANHDPKLRERLEDLQTELAELSVELEHDFIRSQLDRWLKDRLHMSALSRYSFASEQFTKKPTSENRKAMEEAKSFVRDTLFGGNSLPPIVDCAAHEAGPAPAELVNGVWHKGSKLALGGASKAGKTWILQDLAVSLGTGDDWLGLPTVRTKVFYVNFELEDHFFQKRIEAICEAKSVVLEPGWLHHWCLRGQPIEPEVLLPRIARECDRNYGAVIMDPSYKLLGSKNENAMNEVAEIQSLIDNLILKTGAGTAMAQHYSKGNKSSTSVLDRIGGSRAFVADPDTIINFTELEVPEAYAVETTLRTYKPLRKFAVRWKYPLMKVDEHLDPEDLKQATHQKYPDKVFLLPLCENGLNWDAWQATVLAKTKMTARTFKDRAKQLLLRGVVDQDTEHFCDLTPYGNELISNFRASEKKGEARTGEPACPSTR